LAVPAVTSVIVDGVDAPCRFAASNGKLALDDRPPRLGAGRYSDVAFLLALLAVLRELALLELAEADDFVEERAYARASALMASCRRRSASSAQCVLLFACFSETRGGVECVAVVDRG
jgi:hypothetical protein